MDVEEVFQYIGEFGPAQKKIFVLLGCAQIFMAITTLNLAFIGSDPGWKCAVGANASVQVITDSEEKCFHYEHGDCKPEYSNDFTSIVSEWDLICAKASLPNLSQSAFFIGLVIGAWVFGILADILGRKKVFFTTVAFSVSLGIGYSFTQGYYSFLLLRTCLAFSNAGIILSSFVLAVELVGMTKRTFVGIMLGAFFGFGYLVLAMMAYLIRNWRVLNFVGTISGILYLALWRTIPESPRWLLLRGHVEEARNVLERIARGNGTTLPAGGLKKPAAQSTNDSVSTQDLFRGKNIRHRTVVLVATWFTNCMVYYALAMTAGKLGGNRYVSFSLSGLVEIPSLIAAYVLVNRSGRRWTESGLLLISGLGCIAWTLLCWFGSGEGLKVIMALIGKFAVAGSFGVIYLYTAELFPTQVRNLGMGVASIGARVGGIMAPLVLLLSTYNEALPMLVMGGLGIATAVLSTSLPETLNQPMPETLAELEGSTS